MTPLGARPPRATKVQSLGPLLQEDGPAGVHFAEVELHEGSRGASLQIPALVVRGRHPGPIVGLLAGLSGPDLGTVSMLQRLIARVPVDELHGIVVATAVVEARARKSTAPVAGIEGLLPSRSKELATALTLDRLLDRIVRHLDVFVELRSPGADLHSCLHVRCEPGHPLTERLADMQPVDAIVHVHAGKDSLCAAAGALGIASMEIHGDPGRDETVARLGGGLSNILAHLRMLPTLENIPPRPTVCGQPRRIVAERAGILELFVRPADLVEADRVIAATGPIFEPARWRLRADASGIVLSVSTAPFVARGAVVVELGPAESPIDLRPTPPGSR